MDNAFVKMQFKSLMIQIRYFVDKADPELAEIMYRELEREIGALELKRRNCMDKGDETMVQSQSTG